jgi:hypothetical protein
MFSMVFFFARNNAMRLELQRQASQAMFTRTPQCLVLHVLSLVLMREWWHFLSVDGEMSST